MKQKFGNNIFEDIIDGGFSRLYRCDGGQSRLVISCGRGCTAKGCKWEGGSEGGGGEGNQTGEDFVSDGGEYVSLLTLIMKQKS